jgi:hypothetical protein
VLASATTAIQASSSSAVLRRTSMPGGVIGSGVAVQREAQDVLERLEAVAAVAEELADRRLGEVRELDLGGCARSAKAFSTTSSSPALGTPSKPRPTTLLNGESARRKLAIPPAMGIRKPFDAGAGLRGPAGVGDEPVSARSIRRASAVSQKRGERVAMVCLISWWRPWARSEVGGGGSVAVSRAGRTQARQDERAADGLSRDEGSPSSATAVSAPASGCKRVQQAAREALTAPIPMLNASRAPRPQNSTATAATSGGARPW